MINAKQRRLFELTVLHGCTQRQAGELLDPPISQPAVHLLLKDLYNISPELKAVKNYLHKNPDKCSKTPTSQLIRYTKELDSRVTQTF